MSKNVLKYEKAIKAVNDREALGYEDTLSFNHGYLLALKQNKLITTKEYNILIKVYANWGNGNGKWFVAEDGSLGIDKEEEEFPWPV